MIINEKQLNILCIILKDTLKDGPEPEIINPKKYSFPYVQRSHLFEQILNQQSDVRVQVDLDGNVNGLVDEVDKNAALIGEKKFNDDKKDNPN